MFEFVKKWCKFAFVRAIKTVFQTGVATLGVFGSFSEVDWGNVIAVSLFAGFLSLITSMAGIPELEEGKNDETI